MRSEDDDQSIYLIARQTNGGRNGRDLVSEKMPHLRTRLWFSTKSRRINTRRICAFIIIYIYILRADANYRTKLPEHCHWHYNTYCPPKFEHFLATPLDCIVCVSVSLRYPLTSAGPVSVTPRTIHDAFRNTLFEFVDVCFTRKPIVLFRKYFIRNPPVTFDVSTVSMFLRRSSGVIIFFGNTSTN